MKTGQTTRGPDGELGIVESYEEAVYFGGTHVKPAIVVVRYPNGDRDTFHPSNLVPAKLRSAQEIEEGKP